MQDTQLDVITFQAIGIVRSPHREPGLTPIQPGYAEGIEGSIELDDAFLPGLRDLEGFSHIYVLYYMHRAPEPQLLVKPFLQDIEHGVFATRAPCRPNPIGLSIVELLRIEGAVLHIRGIDMLDGTPVLDIKPYVGRFDRIDATRNGWQEEVDEATAQRRGRRGTV